MTKFQEVFLESKISVCMKDRDGMVLFQNEANKKLCSDAMGETCERGCMVNFKNNHPSKSFTEGMQFYPNQSMHCKFFDIVFITDPSTSTTFLYPLEERQKAEKEFYAKYELTNKEREVLEFLIAGETNSTIAEKLNISRNTLKTHINKIYKQIPKDELYQIRIDRSRNT